MTFVVYIASDFIDDDLVIFDAIGPGHDPVYGPAGIGSPDGGPENILIQYFSPILININYYLLGDVNMYKAAWPPMAIGGDVTYLANYFRGLPGSEPCYLNGIWASADVNGDCQIIGSDVTRIVNYFKGNIDITYCPDTPPAWPTPDDLPEEQPEGWPNCE
ncbi:MAG: hypothetical protein GY839_14570 [candidate division Zixibacteria bacterium]|nr:hypothetical protein [candidate division Zixibacteria bacterium]